MHWRLKSAAFQVFSRVPFGASIHFAAQRHITRTLPRKASLLDAHRAKAAKIVADFRSHSDADLGSASFLEIGAGRDLALAISLRALGVGRVIPVDIERLAKLDLVRHAARHIFAAADMLMPRLDSWNDLAAAGIAYTAPATTRDIAGPVDCVYSSEVLEHIDAAALQDFAHDSLRLLKPGGLAIHSIDYSDHFARGDASIDRFNFLQFDDDAWQPHNSRMHFVNRLRPIDYRRIFARAGWRLVDETRNDGAMTRTRRERLNPRFAAYGEDDLLALNGRMIFASGAAPG